MDNHSERCKRPKDVDIIIRKYKFMIDKIILLHEQSNDVNIIYQSISKDFDISIHEFIEIFNSLKLIK